MPSDEGGAYKANWGTVAEGLDCCRQRQLVGLHVEWASEREHLLRHDDR